MAVSASVRPAANLLLTLRDLPRPLPSDVQLECAFGTQFALRTRARTHADGGVQCALPAELGRIPPGSDHTEVALTLRAANTRTDLLVAAAHITLYACGAHRLCSACAASRWPCRWCAGERRCVDAAEVREQCPREKRVSHAAGCARIFPSAAEHGVPELLVPDSANASLELRVDNMPPVDDNVSLACRVAANGLRTARLLQKDRVHCDAGQFGFAEAEAMRNLTLELLMGGEPLDATIVTVNKLIGIFSFNQKMYFF